MPLEILSPIVVGLAALVIVALEHMFPYTPGQRLLREGFWNDLFLYTVVQNYLLGLLIFGIIRSVDSVTEMSRHGYIAAWPIGLQLLLSLLTHDVYIYWFHRLQHRNKWLWRIHEAHHSARSVDWLSGARSHALEILINQTIEFTPLVLLGANPKVILLKGMIDAIWGMYIHSNINMRTGPLRYLINGPEMHRWHHATDGEAHNRNFATKFAVWDWIFGTAFLPERRKPTAYGLGRLRFPRNYFLQQLFAFRAFRGVDRAGDS